MSTPTRFTKKKKITTLNFPNNPKIEYVNTSLVTLDQNLLITFTFAIQGEDAEDVSDKNSPPPPFAKYRVQKKGKLIEGDDEILSPHSSYILLEFIFTAS